MSSTETAPSPRSAADRDEPAPPAAWAVVVNPTKFDDPKEPRRTIGEAAAAAGWPEPMWLESTEDDPGTSMAREAVANGARLVAALGGDGTVRAVAEALVGTPVVLGLLPGGTGNLLARNLDLPVGSLDEALQALVTGRDRRIDVGRVRARGCTDDQCNPAGSGAGHVFTVMAGVGMDAEIVDNAPEALKGKVGWMAYLVSGARALLQQGFRVHIEFDKDERTRFTQHARGVIVGNCGTLQGGVALMPDARVDDGALDVAVLAPQGPVGWGALVAHVLTRTKGHPALRHRQVEFLELRLTEPAPFEIDGDALGSCTAFSVWIERRALTVRVG